MIDNANEKLYRASVGVNNWGVFVASSEFMKTVIVKEMTLKEIKKIAIKQQNKKT